MTIADSGTKVNLAPSNWAALIVTIVLAIAGQWFLLQGRLSTVEIELVRQQTASEDRTRRISQLEQRLDQQRNDWLSEIRELRRDLGIKK